MVVGTRGTGKESIIGGLLILSMVLAETDYAYRADTLSVTTKATMGDFGMAFADLGLYAQYGNETTPNGWNIVDGIGDRAYVNDTFFTRAAASYDKITRDYSVDAYKERQRGYNSVEFNAEFGKPEAIAKNIGPYNTINTKGSRQINITVNQVYPGHTQVFCTDVLNIGSIAMELSSLKFSVKGLEDSDRAADMLGVTLYMDGEQYHPTIDEGKPVSKLMNLLAGESDYFTVDGVNFIRLSALKKLSDEEIRKVITNVTILYSPATGDGMDLLLAIVMDPDAEGVYTVGPTTVLTKNDDRASQKRIVEVSIDFLWDQLNVGKDAGNPNYFVKQNKSEKR